MLLWLMLFISGVLGQEDMKEKLFAFPESSTSVVMIFPDHIGPITECTVCMRFYSSLTREHSLFSMSTENQTDFFLLYYSRLKNQFRQVVDSEEYFYDLQDNITEWTSMCVTWNSSVWGLFINGIYYKVNKTSNVEIISYPNIIIGQSQYHEFYTPWSFVGEMTDVNMWDKALTDENMMDYFADNEMNGNVINWKDLNYFLYGNVTIKPYVDPYPCVQVVGHFVARNGGIVVWHRKLEEVSTDLFHPGGVHLNSISLDMWLLGIQEGIQRVVQVLGDEHM
ncbi:C-reactive protein-like [Leptodactylus fuscus]|uniref:C-reactive protein-like n=1 Tax=Leptodactylus fuscus TaxID=238119 RepID=UPI003F4E66F1